MAGFVDSWLRHASCVVLIAVWLIAAVGGCQQPHEPPKPPAAPSIAEQQRDARRLFEAGRWADVLDRCEAILQSHPDDGPTLLLAGEAATRLERYRDALGYYRRVPSATPENLTATYAAAEIQRVFGSLDQAEVLYRRVLSVDPKHVSALEQLATVLKLTGRHHETRELLLRMLAQGAGQLQHLRWLADPTHPLKARDVLERSLRAVPDQQFVRLGLAEDAWATGDTPQARSMLETLRQTVRQHPDVEALYARCLLAEDDRPAIAAWLAELSVPLRNEADILHLMGTVYELEKQTPTACRCQLECLLRDPDHAAAAHRAGRLLTELGHADDAKVWLSHAERLTDLATRADRVRLESPDAVLCREIAERLEALGRPWEALGWTAIVARLPNADARWVQSAGRRLSELVRSSTPFDRPAVHPDLAALAARFPAPAATLTDRTLVAESSIDSSDVSFRDVAREVGIDFTYFEDHDPTREGRRMPEFTGGGVAVLDYDLNGWPDLYFTQGAELDPAARTGKHVDQLFRNEGDARFNNVTASSHIREDGYSQGVAAGDFNNDGFPDIYVANLGDNRLFANLGDGTFVEIPLPESPSWTTSCAIADVNGDGIPDLYDVNYVTGADLLDRRCATPAGLRVCAPYAFDADPDRLLLGRGDGTFQDVTATAQINPPRGKGLGLLIGPLSGENTTDVFVANDTEANFLLVNQRSRGESPVFADRAVVDGVAFDRDGKPQACMGVAAADFDHNGRLDFFVTNYFNESNALYLSLAEGLFDEACQPSGMRVASLPMLGFGTQAIDANLDGHADLVVANGDLDDFTHETGRAFRLRPQLFLNDGRARFREPKPSSHDDYFAAGSLRRGRGLAWLDGNRDGRPDFVVSHLDEPSALVMNLTVTTGGFIALRCIGTESNRDAVGTRVRLLQEASDGSGPSQLAWITAGDGYQASNERLLLLGVGSQAGPFAVEVRWPSGKTRVFRDLKRNGHYAVVEGRDELFDDAMQMFNQNSFY